MAKKKAPAKRVQKKARPKQPSIAEAAGTSVAASNPENRDLAKRMEEAMSLAVQQAISEVVPLSDSETIKARKMAAREAVLKGASQ